VERFILNKEREKKAQKAFLEMKEVDVWLSSKMTVQITTLSLRLLDSSQNPLVKLNVNKLDVAMRFKSNGSMDLNFDVKSITFTDERTTSTIHQKYKTFFTSHSKSDKDDEG